MKAREGPQKLRGPCRYEIKESPNAVEVVRRGKLKSNATPVPIRTFQSELDVGSPVKTPVLHRGMLHRGLGASGFSIELTYLSAVIP